MSITLATPFSLVTSARYANPASAAEIVPEVYGDLSSGGLRGPVPAVLIDTVNGVYAAAAHAVGSITNVYVGDAEQTIGVDVTVSVSNDYEGQGVIATLDFGSVQGDMVTWRGTGKESGGVLIENTIDQLYDLLTTRSTYVAADFDTALLNLAIAAVDAQGYKTAWVIQDESYVETWIKEFLFNVLGSYRISGGAILEFFVDRGLWVRPSEIVAHIVASRDCVGGDDGVTFRGDIGNTVNALNVDYLWSWSLGQRSSRLTSPQDNISVNAHDEIRKTVILRGHRRQVDVEAYATALFNRLAMRRRVEGGYVEFAVYGSKLMHLAIFDFIALSWAKGPTRENGNGYRNEIIRVISVAHDALRASTAITALDTGTYVLSEEYYDAEVDFDADAYFGGGRELGVVA